MRALLVMLLTAACASSKPPATNDGVVLAKLLPPTARGGGPMARVPRASAIEAYARARCERLHECRAGLSMHDCLVEEQRRARDVLTCETYHPARLEGCTTALRKAECSASPPVCATLCGDAELIDARRDG